MTVSTHDKFSSSDDKEELNIFGQNKDFDKKEKLKNNNQAAANNDLLKFLYSGSDKIESISTAYSFHKTSSDDINQPNRKRNKSKLTLPNKSEVLPRQAVDASTDASFYKARRLKDTKFETTSSANEKGRVKFTDKDVRSFPKVTKSISSRAYEEKYFKSDTKKNSENETIHVNEEGKFHEVWTLLRNMRTFQFPTTPHISEESLVRPNNANRRKRYVHKAPVYMASTGDSFHNNSTIEKQTGVPPIKLKDNIKTKTETSDRMSIKDIYLSKDAGSFTNKKIKKPLKESQSNRKLTQNTKNSSNNKDKYDFLGNNRSERSIKKKPKRSLTNSTSQCGNLKTTNYMQCTNDWAQADANNKSTDIKNTLDDSFGTSNASGYFRGSSKNMTGSRQTPRICNTQPNRIGSPEGYIYESTRINISSQNQQKQTETKRKLRLNTTIPTTVSTADSLRHKYTTTEIKRQLASFKFPLVILGKNELSSTIEVANHDSIQFEGLENHIWPFMANWVQKSPTNSPRNRNKERLANSPPISHRLANVNPGELDLQYRKNLIKQNQPKPLSIKPYKYCESSSGDLNSTQSNFLDADTQTVPVKDKSINKAPVAIRTVSRKYLPRDEKKTLTNKSRLALEDTKHSNKENNYNDYVQMNINQHRNTKTTLRNKYVKDNMQNTKDNFTSRRTVLSVGEHNEPSGENAYLTTYTLYSRGDTSQENRHLCIMKHKSIGDSVRSGEHTNTDSISTFRESMFTDDSMKTITSKHSKKVIRYRTGVLSTTRDIKTAQVSALARNDNGPITRDDKNPGKNSIFTSKYSICGPGSKHTDVKTSLKDSQNTLRNTMFTTRGSRSGWWVTSNDNKEHDDYQTKLALIPSKIHTTSKLEANKRANIIVENAIKMLELGFFYNCVPNPEQKKHTGNSEQHCEANRKQNHVANSGQMFQVNVDKSIETLAQMELNSIPEPDCFACELFNAVSIPGFKSTNDLPVFEIKTMNENEVAIKTCNEDIMIKFDVVEPQSSELNVEKSLSFDEISKLSVSKTQISKVFKCKPSVFNSMLPAELCTMIPSIIRKLESNKEKQQVLPPNQSYMSVSETLESKLHKVPPKILPFIISPELIKYRQGCYTHVQKHREAKQVLKNRKLSCCFYSMQNILIAERILSQVKRESCLSDWPTYCRKPMTPSTDTTKPISSPGYDSTVTTYENTAQKTFENSAEKLNTSAQYFINKMLSIIKDYKVKFNFIYNFSNDTVSIDVTCNKVSNTKSLLPYIKNMTESLKIVNFKINSICDSISGSKPKYFTDMTLDELKLIPTEREMTIESSQLSMLSGKQDIDAKARIKVVELETNNNAHTSAKVRVNVASKNKNILKANVESHWGNVLKNIRIAANNKRSIKVLYKCKSSSSLFYTPISKINKLEDFIRAMGAVGISSALDGNMAERLLSSIAQMREWITEITPRQALLVLLLANKKTTSNLIRLRPLLLQAIAVNRITTASELDTEIDVLEKERLKLIQLQNEEVMYPKTSNNQKDLYEELCWIAKTTAADYQKTFDESSEKLLKSLLEKRKKLNPSYLRVMARYVGLGLLKLPPKTYD